MLQLTDVLALCMQKQQQAKEAEAAAAASEAAPTEAAEVTSGAAGVASDQKKNLVHAWVMVLAGKREVTHRSLSLLFKLTRC